MTRFTLEIKRPAKSKGGDRYESLEMLDGKPLVIYLPQEVSRVQNKVVPRFAMILEIK